MKFQYDHKAFSSVIPWMDYVLANNAEAYVETTGTLTKYTDASLPSEYCVYGSKYKGWVYDSNVAGVSEPEIWAGDAQITEGTSGALFDYENGRVIFTEDVGDATLTGTFFAKEVNVYPSNENEEDLIIDKFYPTNAVLTTETGDYISPYDPTIPAMFVNFETSENTPFALGGEKETKIYAKAVVVTPDVFFLDGILSLFRDSDAQAIPLLENSELPLNYLGDVRSGYNYAALMSARTSANTLHVETVKTSKLSESLRQEISKKFYVGFVDINLVSYRYT